MIVLDTNVVSELMRSTPDPGVLAWVDGQTARSVAITAVTAAELAVGVTLLPRGKRRAAIGAAVDRAVAQFTPRLVWPFDLDAVGRYAEIVVTRTRAGRPIDALEAQIAAICVARGAGLATRNTRDFEGVGLEVIDPWTQ